MISSLRLRPVMETPCLEARDLSCKTVIRRSSEGLVLGANFGRIDGTRGKDAARKAVMMSALRETPPRDTPFWLAMCLS